MEVAIDMALNYVQHKKLPSYCDTLGTNFMAVIYVRRKSMPCIKHGKGDIKARHVDTWHSVGKLKPCITRGIFCEFTSRSKRHPTLESLKSGLQAVASWASCCVCI